MKILHLYSNHKWTGPADHALNLVSWMKPCTGINVFFACGRRRGQQNHLLKKAGERGIACVDGIFLNKHLNWRVIPDIFSLKKMVDRQDINLIHSHQDNDALTAVLAGLGERLIRTSYDGKPFPLSYRQRFIFSRTARIMTASVRVQKHLSKLYPDKLVVQVDIPVDSNHFRPLAKSQKLMAEFGLKADDPVAGIIARVQKHKNFSLLLQAIEPVIREIPRFKFLIVGRGTHIDTLARQPVKQRGLEKNVIFTGYRNEDYGDVINLFDFMVFLTPGSDGSCRAVREALACGKPVIAARKGILSELISNKETGLLIEERPDDLVRAIMSMCRNDDFRQQSSRAARQYAQSILSPERYVQKMIDCYETIDIKGREPG
ncbi:MAG: glycosyltransferase family 4 protein [bacterium]|nr:glycosyltransferase family 4 protein [bacterium]